MRRCTVCGASLEGRRRQAHTCSSGCRRELSRIKAVASGRSDGPTPASLTYSRAIQTVQTARSEPLAAHNGCVPEPDQPQEQSPQCERRLVLLSKVPARPITDEVAEAWAERLFVGFVGGVLAEPE